MKGPSTRLSTFKGCRAELDNSLRQKASVLITYLNILFAHFLLAGVAVRSGSLGRDHRQLHSILVFVKGSLSRRIFGLVIERAHHRPPDLGSLTILVDGSPFRLAGLAGPGRIIRTARQYGAG